MIELRLAVLDDLPALVAAAVEANGESAFVGEFSQPAAEDYYKYFIGQGGRETVIAEQDGAFLGAILLAASWEYWTRPMGYICKIWVTKAGRRTRAARDLFAYADAWSVRNDCLALYVTSTAELNAKEQRLFENLLSRSGYSPVGQTFKKGV